MFTYELKFLIRIKNGIPVSVTPSYHFFFRKKLVFSDPYSKNLVGLDCTRYLSSLLDDSSF